MKNKEFDKLIEKQFDKSSVEPDKDVLNNLKTRIDNYENSKPHPELNKFWIIALSCTCVLVVAILSILLPILLKNDDTSPQRYYAENEVEQVNLSQDFVQNYLNDNYNKYNFILNECTIIDARGIYLKGTSKLLSIYLSVEKNDIPFTKSELNLIVDNNYIFKQDSRYKENALLSRHTEYNLYETEIEEIYNIYMYILIEYENYKLYIRMDIADREFLNNFL